MSRPSSVPDPTLARARRAAWRVWYRARWLALDRRRSTHDVEAQVSGITLRVAPGVFDPEVYFSSELLVQAVRRLDLDADSAALDLGTGTGVGALAAAERAGRVVAVDVEPAAVACANANVARAGLADRIEVRLGDLWDSVSDQRFDLVLWNPPWLTGGSVPGGPLGRALRAEPGLADRFAAGLSDHLAPGGSALVILSTNGDPEAHLRPLLDAGFTADPFLTRDRGVEVLTAWLIRDPSG
jgi:release factor glutamine methyltransferase